ncbi:hypothetical protein D9623_07000 [Azospirillum brasilense]|uniref:Uncharacterized protein n=2 Tax=Azospirillum TaxID=191 RepID=A0A0N7I7N7_AZOBR|nr:MULTISPECIES: hypothetical protein [Azospirillum]ALJ35003.1 hypothetical protein AMK58_05945 [Azospirillum brasilense]AWJ90121.1 hypothetical protein Sp245p_10160 [Azospirillum baldaniorum]MDW7553492.1 hypothetical protein [Azospirillum brasilense]MDW7594302.1 hypothetical protein [Azospirillum brasilense]MDW7629174.1 hypothetical protein [Azospirillum brasilense]
MGKVANIVVQMARKLTDDNARLGRVRNAGKPKTFPHFREIRNAYLDIQGLVFSIQERLQEAGDELPSNFPQWVIRQKLTAIAHFTDISYAFVSDPPLALTSSLGAFDVLQAEQKAFSETLNAFDMMLMEAGIDDKTADELDATRTKIEQILGMIETLLENSPKVLQEF